MTAPFFTQSGVPKQDTVGQSRAVRAEFKAIETALDTFNLYPLTRWIYDIQGTGGGVNNQRIVAPFKCRAAGFGWIVNKNTLDSPTFRWTITGGITAGFRTVPWENASTVGAEIESATSSSLVGSSAFEPIRTGEANSSGQLDGDLCHAGEFFTLATSGSYGSNDVDAFVTLWVKRVV